MNEKQIMGLLFVAIMLVFSFGYVGTETQAIANDDPTHRGKAFVAFITPWFWMLLIISDLGIMFIEIFKDYS